MKAKETIQDWLNLMEISWTSGTITINWTDVMQLAKDQASVFFDEVDDQGDKRLVGWTFLSNEEVLSGEEDDEDEEESDSEYNSEEHEESESDDGSFC